MMVTLLTMLIRQFLDDLQARRVVANGKSSDMVPGLMFSVSYPVVSRRPLPWVLAIMVAIRKNSTVCTVVRRIRKVTGSTTFPRGIGSLTVDQFRSDLLGPYLSIVVTVRTVVLCRQEQQPWRQRMQRPFSRTRGDTSYC